MYSYQESDFYLCHCFTSWLFLAGIDIVCSLVAGTVLHSCYSSWSSDTVSYSIPEARTLLSPPGYFLTPRPVNNFFCVCACWQKAQGVIDVSDQIPTALLLHSVWLFNLQIFVVLKKKSNQNKTHSHKLSITFRAGENYRQQELSFPTEEETKMESCRKY